MKNIAKILIKTVSLFVLGIIFLFSLYVLFISYDEYKGHKKLEIILQEVNMGASREAVLNAIGEPDIIILPNDIIPDLQYIYGIENSDFLNIRITFDKEGKVREVYLPKELRIDK